MVEDDPDVLDLCKRILASEGYQVKDAGDGYEAIERAKDEHFDLLLVDIKMPRMNGLETYQAIKEFDPDIIGVIITGYASMETAIEAVKLGFDGFITKPFTPEDLNAAVARALERKRLERENARLRALIPLFEMSKAFMTTMDLDELLNQVVHVARKETKADRVSLMLLDEASGELSIEAAVGLHRGVVAEARERVGEGIAGYVAKRGEPLLLNDEVPLDPQLRKAMRGRKITSALCVPLMVKDRVIGVLNLSKLGEPPFTEGDLELVSVLCGQAAIAIENARLFEELERWGSELEARVEERTKELEEAQDRLIRAEKLAAIGQLGASVGHELRNPLGVIKNSVYYLKMKLKDADEKVRKHLGIIEREIARSNKIINDLLSFARAKAPDLKEVNINALVKGALSRTPVPENVAVVTELREGLPPLMADPEQIEQVFINMILNAVQAMPNGGRLVIKSEVQSQRTPDPGSRTSDFVAVSFTDNGCGIPEKNMEKLFEPLFTTKAKGIGMGLAISKRIIEAHGGSIEVESEVGVGTTFTARLPLAGERGSRGEKGRR